MGWCMCYFEHILVGKLYYLSTGAVELCLEQQGSPVRKKSKNDLSDKQTIGTVECRRKERSRRSCLLVERAKFASHDTVSTGVFYHGKRAAAFQRQTSVLVFTRMTCYRNWWKIITIFWTTTYYFSRIARGHTDGRWQKSRWQDSWLPIKQARPKLPWPPRVRSHVVWVHRPESEVKESSRAESGAADDQEQSYRLET